MESTSLAQAAGADPVRPSTPPDALFSLALAQQEQLSLLRAQNEMLKALVQRLGTAQQQVGLLHVKVEDVNMPFWALVGFILKSTFASIPAAMVILVVWFFLLAGASFFCGGLTSLPLLIQ